MITNDYHGYFLMILPMIHYRQPSSNDKHLSIMINHVYVRDSENQFLDNHLVMVNISI